MAKRKITQTAQQEAESDLLVDVAEVRETAADFWAKNGKMISIIGGGLALLIGGWLAYKYLVTGPNQKAAVEGMWQAQQMFEKDSFQLALDGPGGGAAGFLQIIDENGSSPAGNAAKYYAGISYLQLGNFDKAIEYLEDCSASGEILPIMRAGALGDAYSEKGEASKATNFYEKAISAGDNEVLTAIYMKKLAMFNEKNGDLASAKKLYEQIKAKYPTSPVAADIERYIIRTSK